MQWPDCILAQLTLTIHWGWVGQMWPPNHDAIRWQSDLKFGTHCAGPTATKFTHSVYCFYMRATILTFYNSHRSDLTTLLHWLSKRIRMGGWQPQTTTTVCPSLKCILVTCPDSPLKFLHPPVINHKLTWLWSACSLSAADIVCLSNSFLSLATSVCHSFLLSSWTCKILCSFCSMAWRRLLSSASSSC